MRFGQKKMARRRDDHARGIPLQTDPSYDEDDPEVQAAAVKLQSLTRGVQARQKATEKKTDKKKNKLRLKGRQNKSNETEKVDDPPKSASRNFSVRNLLSRGASREVSPPNSRPNSSKELPVVQNKKSARASSPTSPSNSRPNSRQNSASSARKGYKDKDSDKDISPASPSESLRRSYTESNLSRPTSGQKSKPTSRPSSRESSFKGMLSRGLSSLRTKDVKAEEIKADNRKYTEGDEEEEIDEVGDAGKESFSAPANSRNNSSSSSRRKTEQSGGDLKKPIPLQPKTPSRPVEELDHQRVESPQKEEEEENGKNSDTESKSRPTSVRSVKSSSRPSSSSIKKTPTANSSRPTSPVMKSPSSPQSQDIHTVATLSSKSRKVEDEEVDAQSMAEDLEQARKKVGGDMEEAGEKCEVEEEEDNGKENKKDETDDNEAAQEQVEQVEKQEDVDRKAKEKAARSASFKIKRSATPKPPSIDDEGGSRGRPLSREGSKRAVSPGGGLLRQASSKIFGRFNSTDAVDSPDAGSTRSKSPSLLSRSPSLSQSFKSMSSKFSASFRGPVKYKPNATYKPKVRTLVPRNNDEAATRISSIVRQRLGYKKLKAKKKEIRNLQKKAGLIVLWAIVTIQRVIRGRIGRWRWTRLHKEHKALLAKEENDRIWKELEEEEEREKAEKAEKQRLADEQEERNNAMWSQYGKPKPKGEGDGKGKIGDGGDIDPSHRVIPPPTTEPPPLHSTQPLHSSAGVSELDERMRRLEEMEKTMIEKEERMILAAQRAEEKAAEMQRAIEAMEKRAQEDEAEKQVRRSMMELAAGPMSSLGSQLSTGPVRSSRPSARNMVSSRSSGANSSRPPPSARSAKDGTPRPKEVLTVHVHGVEWCQLWDADENAWYWYCESTGVAQWDQPTESGGYESNGALTDYSTENDGWNTESGSQWQEYWDEQAQAKYWYNTSTGEASWTPPEAEVGSAGSFQGPAGDDWVSYIDDATGEEYWYNTKTGETSWSN